MKVLIAGAGAVGAFIGARMAQAGSDVVLFARGPHCRAMRTGGIRVQSAEGEFVVKPKVVDDLHEAGKADVVFLGVKAHGLGTLAPQLEPVVGADTVFVSTQNGIPWWYFQKCGGELEGIRIDRVDPNGIISSTIDPNRVVGSIVYFSSEIIEPGLVRHVEGNRVTLGEPDGSRSERIRMIAAALVQAGFRAPVTTRIRHEIWVKLLGNMTFNPISTLTGATIREMLEHPDVSALVRKMMREAEAVANAVGITLPISIEKRLAGAAKVGEHRTSMLQDFEAGRPLELEALVGAVVELGERVGIEMPYTRAIYAATKLRARRRT